MRRILMTGLVALSVAATPATAANLTPDQLTQATSAGASDLLLIYPTGGPMKSVQWSVVTSLMQSALGGTFLQVGNNLADVPSPSSARNNLGLGTAATLNTGTSGVALPLLNGANTWSGSQTFSLANTFNGASAFNGKVTLFASTTAGAPLNIPQGIAPTSPANGDCWTTGAGFFCQISGATQGPFAASTGTVTTTGSPAAGALAKFSGTASVTSGDLSGDCTTSGALAIICAKTGGTAFGTAATKNTGTSGANIPLMNGGNSWTGNQTLSGATLTPDTVKGIVGTTAGDNAQAGSVGEYISSSVAVGSAVALTTTTTSNITSVSLTAGDWSCSGNVGLHGAASTVVTTMDAVIGTTSATFPAAPAGGAEAGFNGSFQTPGGAAGDIIMSLGTVRENVSSTTTVFLMTFTVFTTSTLAAYGFIGCRRVR